MGLGLLCLSSFVAALAFPPPPGLNEYQRQLLTRHRAEAEKNSAAAEDDLLKVFASSAYRRELARVGDTALAALTPEQSLARLKLAMDSIEYVTTFGLTPEQLKKDPDMASCCATPNISTLDTWGYYPNIWQLEHVHSSLESKVPDAQLTIYDSSEVSLYDLEPFSAPVPKTPSWEEASGRGVYVSINQRRLAAGVEMFGPLGLVYRGDVARERALAIAVDDGHWQMACNKSVHVPWAKWWWPIASKIYDCEGIGGKGYGEPGFRPPAAMLGAQLHLLARHVQTFERMGESLPRLLVQILSPKGTNVPVEQNFYQEAVILGAVQMTDLKMILALFMPLFGTSLGDELVAFCKKNQIPLLWGLGSALGDKDQHWYQKLPAPLGRPAVRGGAPRLLDPATAPFTNASAAGAAAAWEPVLVQARAHRNEGLEVDHDVAVGWWNSLAAAKTSVVPLFGGECANQDFAVGTLDGDCVMRQMQTPESLLI